nr:PREDICTED: zinc transporter ZIP11 isoform X2 [Bemisia tabaci]
MLPNYGPVTQTILGTAFTWGLTALGAGVIIFIKGSHRKFLDASLGFASGVMIAASFWSLLAPAIEMAENSGSYGKNGAFAFVPVAIGFFIGSLFVFLTDHCISMFGLCSVGNVISMHKDRQRKNTQNFDYNSAYSKKCDYDDTTTIEGFSAYASDVYRRKTDREVKPEYTSEKSKIEDSHWKRILLLVIAITVHNIPEGLAVGVAFGAVGSTPSASFENARNLAIGIGIQNFPEGLAVSLPLHAAGVSTWKSFWWGQLSGMVEPFFGLLGVIAVALVEPLLPYALSFAAGAMIYVVVDDIIPEANSSAASTDTPSILRLSYP